MSERWARPVFNREMIRKYDRPGPRYTSYPTAPHFTESFDSEAYRRVIEETNLALSPPPLSLYFHLPFCSSLCWFCGCNVFHTKDRSAGNGYVDAVLEEMDEALKLMKPGRKVVQLHWGGGTPTFMSVDTLRRFWSGIKERFEMDENAEIGVEIDPRETSAEHLEFFAEAGFNRLSMGVQDFDPKVQEAVHRIQPEELTMRVFDACRKLGFESLNVDLIYGLPHQRVETFKKTVDKIVETAPDRIAVFNFAYLPEMLKHQRAIDANALPSPDEKLSILEMTADSFIDAGYVFVGMDHFARPEDELCEALRTRTLYRNFQGYTTKAGCDLYGFGVTSIGQVGASYSQNSKNLTDYMKRVADNGFAVFRGVELTKDDILRRDVINRLMCHFIVYKREIEEEHGIDFDETFADALRNLVPMAGDGLVKLLPDRIEILPLGRLLVRNVAMAFDAYLQGAEGKGRFSRTV